MLNKNGILWLLSIMLLGSPVGLAGDPQNILQRMFRKKLDLSDQSLELKVEHGPWMILATTLAGEGSQEKAALLAQEIRSSMRLPCYVMQKSIGDSQTLATREREKTDLYGNQKRYNLELKYANSSPTVAYAVLVGDFSSDYDPRIPDTLEKIRSAQPQALAEPEESKATTEDEANWLIKKSRSMFWSMSERNKKNGPMGAAFVTRNPLLPDDYFQAPELDALVESLNREDFVEFPLLDCPGKFTVRVASFRGYEATDFGNGEQVAKLNDKPMTLDDAALKANSMAKALRKKGVEAYEFHDRHGSYVTIGSFDNLGRELESGQFEYNPAMLRVLDEYCGYTIVEFKDLRTGASAKRTTLKTEGKIPFDLKGKPIAVPRPEMSKLYNNSLLGGR